MNRQGKPKNLEDMYCGIQKEVVEKTKCYSGTVQCGNETEKSISGRHRTVSFILG